MIKMNWADVEEAKGFEQIEAGGYICHIVSVEDVEDKEFLRIAVDIDEGEHKGFGERTEERTGATFGYPSGVRSYRGKAVYFFKRFLNNLQKSNKRFKADKFDNNPDSLKDLQIGCVIGLEEYVGRDKDGNNVKKTRCRINDFITVEDIKNGNFEIPALKKLTPEQEEQINGVVYGATEEIPF